MHALPPIGHADLHVHPSGNAASAKTPMTVYAALLASDLQVAVLTDHNRVDVARELVARSRDEGVPIELVVGEEITTRDCLLYTSPSPRDRTRYRMPSS